MRKVGILTAVKQSLWMPEKQRERNWPLCMTCGRDVDAFAIVDEGVKEGLRYVDVQARHHEQHDTIRINFLSKHPTTSDFQMAVQACHFFDPNEGHVDAGFSAGGL